MSYQSFGQAAPTLLTTRLTQMLPTIQKIAPLVQSYAPPGTTPALTSPPVTEAAPPGEESGAIIYIGLGVAALALGGAIYWKYRKKKGA